MSGKIMRSRNGCKNCKRMKVKCDENKPKCTNCIKKKIEKCDYSLVLKWGGRPFKDQSRSSTSNLPNTDIKDGVVIFDTEQLKNDEYKVTKPRKKVVTNYEKITFIEERVNNGSELVEVEIKSPVASNGGVYDDIIQSKNEYNNVVISPMTEFILQMQSEHITLKYSLKGLQLPNPLPAILTKSHDNMELFDFYLAKSADLLVPTPHHGNPFKHLLPQMAMQSPTLLYLLLAFGANHKSKMITHPDSFQSHSSSPDPPIVSTVDPIDPESFNSMNNFQDFMFQEFWSPLVEDSMTDDLLALTFKELVIALQDDKQRKSDATLAAIMMLTSFDIFFSDKRRTWRKHLDGARKIISERLPVSKSNSICISPSEDLSSTLFLNRWFSYIDIIGTLSSSNPASHSKNSTFTYHFIEDVDSDEAKRMMDNKRLQMDDIELWTGMEPKMLTLLSKVSWLIGSKEEDHFKFISTQLVNRALELDHEISEYLKSSELSRIQVFENIYQSHIPAYLKDRYEIYKILRTTNMICGLTGSLQIKRRVLEIPQESKIIKDLLVQITGLIEANIPLCSSTTTCSLFCLFCCGCELLSQDLVYLRSTYIKRIDGLTNIGVSSASMAKDIMEQCWKEKKSWWKVLKERKLDITFAI